jgi:hypothetical protein
MKLMTSAEAVMSKARAPKGRVMASACRNVARVPAGPQEACSICAGAGSMPMTEPEIAQDHDLEQRRSAEHLLKWIREPHQEHQRGCACRQKQRDQKVDAEGGELFPPVDHGCEASFCASSA